MGLITFDILHGEGINQNSQNRITSLQSIQSPLDRISRGGKVIYTEGNSLLSIMCVMQAMNQFLSDTPPSRVVSWIFHCRATYNVERHTQSSNCCRGCNEARKPPIYFTHGMNSQWQKNGNSQILSPASCVSCSNTLLRCSATKPNKSCNEWTSIRPSSMSQPWDLTLPSSTQTLSPHLTRSGSPKPLHYAIPHSSLKIQTHIQKSKGTATRNMPKKSNQSMRSLYDSVAIRRGSNGGQTGHPMARKVAMEGQIRLEWCENARTGRRR